MIIIILFYFLFLFFGFSIYYHHRFYSHTRKAMEGRPEDYHIPFKMRCLTMVLIASSLDLKEDLDEEQRSFPS
jgi:hypothetical protein